MSPPRKRTPPRPTPSPRITPRPPADTTPPANSMVPVGEMPPVDPARILFQGHGILVYDKPAGTPMHFGTDHPFGLAEALDAFARHNPGVIEIAANRKIAPLHRLDLEASGVVLFGLERAASTAVQELFAAGKVEKRYLAVVAGPLEEEAVIEGTVRSRLRGVYRQLPSRIQYRRIAGDERLSLVVVRPTGGRTHQIRSLFSAIGRPLAGDLRYGKPKPARQFLEKFNTASLLLHALSLAVPRGPFPDPETFTAPIPEALRRLAEAKGWKIGEIPGLGVL